MFGPTDVIKAAANFQSHLTSNVNNIAQVAALEAVSGPLDAVYEMREAFDRRRRLMVSMLSEIPGLKVPNPKGAFYAYPSVEALIGREIGGKLITSSAVLSDVILEKAEVAVVPGEAFGPSGFIRLSYALSDAELIKGVERIARLLEN